MNAKTPDPTGDFEAMARQYWNAWAELARTGSGSVAGGSALPGWKDGLAWWSQLAGQGRGDTLDATLERMNAQAGAWFGAMQDLAASFAGRDASPADIGRAWRAQLGDHPVADLFRRMGDPQSQGVEAWLQQAAPFFGALRGDADGWLRMPAFGLSREHQERGQRVQRAMQEFQRASAQYNAQLQRAAKLAFERFEDRLAERGEPGRQIDSARALFDVWIDAAEAAWSEVALSEEYRRDYGAFVNAMMRVRSGVQAEIEHIAGLFGLPTRSELDGSHQRLAALEREVRRLRAELAAGKMSRSTPKSTASDEAPVASGEDAKPAPAPTPQPRSKGRTRGSTARKRKQAPSRSRATPARKTVLPQVTAPRAVGSAAKPRKSAAKTSTPAKRRRRS